MSAPTKRKRRRSRTALQVTNVSVSYRLLELVQAPFGFVFWFIEQRKGRLHDRIANERSGR
jgi:hypothetical protein